MKKKVLFGLGLMALTLGGLTTSMANQSTSDLTSLQMKNLEALTDTENQESGTCYHTITSQEGCKTLYCGTCQYIPGAPSWVSGTGTCPKK